MANKIFRLVGSHLMIKEQDDARYILCQFRERGVPVQVLFAAAGNEVDGHGKQGMSTT